MALTLPDTSAWLAEDVGTGDVTTLALIGEDATCTAVVLAKEAGVVCGLEAARTVFAELGVGFEPVVGKEPRSTGPDCRAGRPRARRAHGRAAGAQPHRPALRDRHAHAPLRRGRRHRRHHPRHAQDDARPARSRNAVTGGATNHRFGLDDGVLVKDNHLRLTGGIAPAVAALRAATDLPVEIEADTVEQVRDAVEAGADAILLDNMSTDELREAVALVAGRAKLEASGGVSLDTVARSPRPESTSSPSARSPIRPAHSMFPWRCSRDHANDRPNAGRGEGAGA